ncbi:MAG: hypothetical protein AAFN10_19560, partial [Bacteroidota bacterium]
MRKLDPEGKSDEGERVLSPSQRKDAEAWTQCHAGDERGYVYIIEEYSVGLRYYFRRSERLTIEDAEDVVAEIFSKIVMRIATMPKEIENLWSFLVQIGRYIVLNRKKKAISIQLEEGYDVGYHHHLDIERRFQLEYARREVQRLKNQEYKEILMLTLQGYNT